MCTYVGVYASSHKDLGPGEDGAGVTAGGRADAGAARVGRSGHGLLT